MGEEKYLLYCKGYGTRWKLLDKATNAESAVQKAVKAAPLFAEVMLTDADDCTVFHMKGEELLFPKIAERKEKCVCYV